MTTQPPRRGGWPGPRKETAWTFKPDADAEAAVTRYMEVHGLTRSEWGVLTKVLNAMLATHPAARPATPDTDPGGYTPGASSVKASEVGPVIPPDMIRHIGKPETEEPS